MEAKEIVKVIKACKEAGVTKFENGETKIFFEQIKEQHHISYQNAAVMDQVTEPFSEEIEEALLQEQKVFENEMLIIEDPVEWEKRELEDLTD